jgi:adenylate cyclase
VSTFAIPNDVSEEALRAQLKKMLQSESFARSRRLRRFLRFCVEQTLLEQTENLKEYSIGLEVFEKPESFDPRMDSIVRVVARRLRSMVEHYYATEGKDDPIAIKFRCGSYVPAFELRSAEQQSAELPEAVTVVRPNATAEYVASQLGMPLLPLTPESAEELLQRVASGGAQLFLLSPVSQAAQAAGGSPISEPDSMPEEVASLPRQES